MPYGSLAYNTATCVAFHFWNKSHAALASNWALAMVLPKNGNLDFSSKSRGAGGDDNDADADALWVAVVIVVDLLLLLVH